MTLEEQLKLKMLHYAVLKENDYYFTNNYIRNDYTDKMNGFMNEIKELYNFTIKDFLLEYGISNILDSCKLDLNELIELVDYLNKENMSKHLEELKKHSFIMN